ncbi:hypothetical protein D3C76_1518800 [compost metagenome]
MMQRPFFKIADLLAQSIEFCRANAVLVFVAQVLDVFFNGRELFRQAAECIDLFVQADHAALIDSVVQALKRDRGVIDQLVHVGPAFGDVVDAFQ